jgi:hypothetical protein
VYDVIKRIKAGSFKGADYVLFGTVSDIDFTRDMNELANTDSYSAVLALTLVADFSLHGDGRRSGHQTGEWPGHPGFPEPPTGGA